ncbi:hypothetical protein R1flu_021638 [Riccia fluitans]|uniref:Uncharacterized protein n=1 Tax=Riccia fluitans TaxID=41844 RepID=A0ABD1ZRK8_9MARC
MAPRSCYWRAFSNKTETSSHVEYSILSTSLHHGGLSRGGTLSLHLRFAIRAMRKNDLWRSRCRLGRPRLLEVLPRAIGPDPNTVDSQPKIAGLLPSGGANNVRKDRGQPSESRYPLGSNLEFDPSGVAAVAGHALNC